MSLRVAGSVDLLSNRNEIPVEFFSAAHFKEDRSSVSSSLNRVLGTTTEEENKKFGLRCPILQGQYMPCRVYRFIRTIHSFWLYPDETTQANICMDVYIYIIEAFKHNIVVAVGSGSSVLAYAVSVCFNIRSCSWLNGKKA